MIISAGLISQKYKGKNTSLEIGILEYGAGTDLQLCCVRPIQLVSYSFLWGSFH